MAVAQGAGEGLSAWGQYLSEGEMRKLQALQRQIGEWKFGQGKNLYTSLMKMLKSGETLAPGKRASMIGKNEQAMQGTFGRILAALGQKGDLRNPALGKQFAETYMPMQAQFSNQLDMKNMDELSKLRSMLMSATWG